MFFIFVLQFHQNYFHVAQNLISLFRTCRFFGGVTLTTCFYCSCAINCYTTGLQFFSISSQRNCAYFLILTTFCSVLSLSWKDSLMCSCVVAIFFQVAYFVAFQMFQLKILRFNCYGCYACSLVYRVAKINFFLCLLL